MATSLVSTGVQFPDSTIQTTAATAGGSITATASGAISIGNPVVVNSNGTVSAVTATVNTSSTWTTLNSGTDSTANNAWTGDVSFSYDPSTGIIVMWYKRNTGTLAAKAFRFKSDGTFQVGAMADVGYTVLGAPKAVGCTNTGGTFTHAALIVDNNGANFFWLNTGLVNTTTLAISIVSNTLITTSVSHPIAIGYHEALNRIGVAGYYGNNLDYTLHNLKLNSDGTTSNDGNDLLMSDPTFYNALFVYESTQQRLIFIGTPSGNSNWPTAYPLNFTGSGNSTMSFGTITTVFSSTLPGGIISASGIGSSQISVFTMTSGGTGRFNIGTVSGSTVSFGGFNTTGLSGYNNSTSFLLTGTSTYVVQSGGYYQPFTLSGSTATFSSVRALPNTSTNTVMYLSTGGEINTIANTSSPTVVCYALSPYNTNVTANNFIGFSAGTYANAATATVNVVGGTNNNQTGLTAGTKYYVGPTGTLNVTSTNPYAGVALSATNILIKG